MGRTLSSRKGTTWRRFRWRWLLAIVVLTAADVLVLSNRSGECFDYAGGAGGQSTCTHGPGPGAWAVAALSLVAIIFCARRLIHSGRR